MRILHVDLRALYQFRINVAWFVIVEAYLGVGMIKTIKRLWFGALCVLLLLPGMSLGGTSDPTGIAGLIIGAVVLGPLVLLVLIFGGVGASAAGGRGFLKGGAVGVVVFLIGFMIFIGGGRQEEEKRMAVAAERSRAISECSGELAAVADEYKVDSLLVESGLIDRFMLRDLLGERGLKFVELRAGAIKSKNDSPAKWGVRSFQGDGSWWHLMNENEPIVRVSLAPRGDSRCTTREFLGIDFSSPHMPFFPDVCFHVENVSESSASHALRAISLDNKPGFIKWSLVEQASGKVLVGLTSSDQPRAPIRQGGGGDRELKIAKGRVVSCLQPHFSLMETFYGEPNRNMPHLSLFKRIVEAKELDETEPATWPVMAADEEEIGDWGQPESRYRLKSTWDKDWREAFESSERVGPVGIERYLIDARTGEYFDLRIPKYKSAWLRSYMGASKEGFVSVSPFYPHVPHGLLLVSYSRSGDVLWRGLLVSLTQGEERTTGFDPLGVEIDGGTVRVYGFRRAGDTSKATMLKVPKGALGLK